MTYKVIEKITRARDFKTRKEAQKFAEETIKEDEDTTWEIKRE
jgi:hypothetical protein